MTFAAAWRSPAAQTLRLVASCAVADGLSRLCGLKEGYWALITAIVVTLPAFTDTWAAAVNRVTGTVIGAVAGFCVLLAAAHGLPVALLFWAALLPLAMLTALRQNLRLSCVTLIVVVLIPSNGPVFARPLDRVFGILLGTAASILVSGATRTRAKV